MALELINLFSENYIFEKDKPSYEDRAHAYEITKNPDLKYKGKNLTFYDASYVELALRRNCPLATKDLAMHHVAKKCNIELLVPECFLSEKKIRIDTRTKMDRGR